MLFVDDEGTEIGGIMWVGSKDKQGRIESNGHLGSTNTCRTRYFRSMLARSPASGYSAITISDRGDYAITDALEASNRIHALPEDQRRAEWKKFEAAHPGDHNRSRLHD
jgi:hypothetical protein